MAALFMDEDMSNVDRRVPISGWHLPGFHSRVLTSADAAAAQTLFEEAVDFSLLVTGLPPAPDEGEKLFTDLPPGWPVESKTVFGLFAAEKLIGVLDSIDGYPEAGLWFIGLFLLHPAWRGKGVGRAWLEAYLNLAEGNGIGAVRLGVVEQNEVGRVFWEAMGFRLEARRPPVRYGNKDNIVLVMRRELRQKS